MPRMRLLTTFMSPGGSPPIREIGEVHDFPESDVAELVRRGLAEVVEHDHPEKDEARAPRKRVAK